jgi:predicted permease
LIHLLQVFANNIVPIILVAGAGFTLQRYFKIEPRPLSITVFNILTPALVLNLLIKISIPADGVIRLAAVASIVILVLVLVSWLIGRWLKLDARMISALILGASFMNAGNYGLSLNQIALGQIGLAWASIFFITNALWTNSLGVIVAQAGRISVPRALLGLTRVPAVYAAIIALAVRLSGLELPTLLLEPVELLSSATVPVMLLVLGMQIGKAGLPKRPGMLAVVSVLQLVVAPLFAWAMSHLVQLPSPGAEVAVLESAMPTAVLSMILALEFDVEPEFVTSAVVVTTLLSPLTITPILVILGIG